MRPAVEIKDLVKTYDGDRALDRISFTIQEGEIFGFLGPNGAGKTTTINCITGLSTITSGAIAVFGFDVVREYVQARKCIGLSPQEYSFDVYFTVQEIMEFQAGYMGIPKNHSLPRIRELLELFDLEKKAKVKVRQLSGGMKRRLSIAKAMVHDPKLLILDEPTAALDVDLRLEMWDYLNKLKGQGKTILLTTHYIDEAERLADRVGIIHHGRIIMIRNTGEIIKELGNATIRVRPKKLAIPPGIKGKIEHDSILFSNLPVEAIIKAFQKEKNPVLDISTEKEDLEDIFVRLTR
ncbi:ABC transporter ATP-binding protein [Candidatus Woesearchaeota archaeon]|nr:MAG: antibiotic transport system ATP-binding protein [archaeon GW2011_AR4]MBS3130511.1 ABC transporter ATP-binding protein [Candidatus Woesearchaeota archaeon]HIH37991.1 ABC transporter ATP-binding protein [Candidatus Woesearchaeota archaeon]HIJ02960.1 ABC transporter ATP-binding protein [Candidatus Woesearchaeota archaeon]